jgi:hypothetical protein
MQLRKYPVNRFRDSSQLAAGMSRLGRINAKAAKTLTGEIGILKQVRCYEDRPGKIYLTVVYHGTTYVGCLLFDDQRFWKKSFEHLRRCYGKAINEIGSSEIVSIE